MASIPALVWRLRQTLRRLRRTTAIGPLLEALQVRAVLRRVLGDPEHVRVLAPDEFAPFLRVMRSSTDGLTDRDLRAFEYVVIRQDRLSALDPRLLDTLRSGFVCTYANARFALFAPGARPESARDAAAVAAEQRVDALAPGARVDRPVVQVSRPAPGRAILVTTFARPAALQRTLPQLAALGQPLLVVDDGSAGAAAEANRDICRQCDATLIALPANRGLAAANNIGLAYLLADRAIEWISYFQDDVDVDPDVLNRLALVEHPIERPILTGYDAPEHPTEREEVIGGVPVKVKRSTPAVHLHAHVRYWSGVMPIPTEYLGAPRRRWQASLEDYWIVNNAPGSVGQRGLPVICVPGLVRTFLWHHADSTWGNATQSEAPATAVRE